MMKKIDIIETFVYYDGPVLFEGRDHRGSRYVGMAIDSGGADDLFAVVEVAAEGLSKFRDGSLDLLTLVLDRDDGVWFIGAMSKDKSDALDITEQTTPIADSDYLPERGFFLPDNTVSGGADEYDRYVGKVSGESLEASHEHTIRDVQARRDKGEKAED